MSGHSPSTVKIEGVVWPSPDYRETSATAPKELWHLRVAIPVWLEDAENGLSARFRRLLNGLWQDLLVLDQRMTELDREIALIANADPIAKRLQQLRGVGPMIATALVATVGDANSSPTVDRWRHLSA